MQPDADPCSRWAELLVPRVELGHVGEVHQHHRGQSGHRVRHSKSPNKDVLSVRFSVESMIPEQGGSAPLREAVCSKR